MSNTGEGNFNAQPRGRPKDEGKRLAILAAARKLFLAHPYDRVSLDAIAAEGGVSKVTVYSHFPAGKQEVFVAALSFKAADVFGAAELASEKGVPLEPTLARLGLEFVLMITDEEVGAMQAALMVEGRRDPSLSLMFHEMVIVRWTDVLAALLGREAAKGSIYCPDPTNAAHQFLAMVQGDFKLRHMMGLLRGSEDEIKAYTQACAAVFMRAMRPG
jgi:TetR/AcrR family transcriptional regulator, mexJK operon transcriptional repressor